jgi:hypothetical protein
MTSAVARLPGVYFESPPSSLDEVLPRMDIALFVGFASSGEPNKPRLIEDAEEFRKIFGDDVELCWDEERGEIVYGWLGTAVRSFFLNGGRRCWVVRVPHESYGDAATPFSDLFLDPRLRDAVSVPELENMVDLYRSQHVGRAGFIGVHSALDPGEKCDMDEVTIIVVPDAVHPGREPATLTPIEHPGPSSPSSHPNWWHFVGCMPVPEEKLPREALSSTKPDRAEFQRCDLVVLEAPILQEANVAEDGTIVLTWRWDVPGPGEWSGTFVLQESRRTDWSDAAPIYQGGLTSFNLRGRQPGDYFYRVRVEGLGEVSNWSNGIAARVVGARGWKQKVAGTLDEQITIHRALLMLCATRGDCVAMLSLPRHVREEGAKKHCADLRANLGDQTVLSFGAVYHPWLIGREQSQPDLIRAIPPDGAVSGVMAARTRATGAWISAANEPLQNVFALDPHLQIEDAPALQEGYVNVVWPGPRGFRSLSAQTLSDDPQWCDLNVRRLMCLLRRVALKHGVRYVFEPNSDPFRRAVQQGFENLLRQLFLRGAFAGRVATEAYQVVADWRVNTPQQIDLGQLVVELRVAPSLPMKFITVRLLQSQEGALVQEIV